MSKPIFTLLTAMISETREHFVPLEKIWKSIVKDAISIAPLSENRA